MSTIVDKSTYRGDFYNPKSLQYIEGTAVTGGKGWYIFMDYKKMLHEIIDSLDGKTAKHLYLLVMGVLGRMF